MRAIGHALRSRRAGCTRPATKSRWLCGSGEAVDVDVSGGKPRVPLTIGSATRYADYSFKKREHPSPSVYTVQIGDYDADGFHVDDSSLELNGGTIKRANSSVNADLDHPALAADSDYAVDARATAPEAPTGLTATALGATIVDLAWTAPADGGSAITGYKVEVSNDGSSGWSDLEDDTGERERLVPPQRAFQRRHPALPGFGDQRAGHVARVRQRRRHHHDRRPPRRARRHLRGRSSWSATMTVGTSPGSHSVWATTPRLLATFTYGAALSDVTFDLDGDTTAEIQDVLSR